MASIHKHYYGNTRQLITLFVVALMALIFTGVKASAQKTIRYDLYVRDTMVNYSGKKANAIAINGQIPAPQLNFTEGDTAEIFVHNEMNVETSIHWHGIILPYGQDGVPYLTTAPIKAHTTYRYYFPIVQSGTYWYHSHTRLQEQSGLYGALIIQKKQREILPEVTVVLSDWTNEKPHEVLRSLKSANDWYGIKKHATQNWGEATIKGHFGTKAKQEWLRMLAMDVSDVYYDRFLTNGKPEAQAPTYKAGDKVRLRVINGSASTYFWLQFAGSKLTVVASDGEDVVPVEVDRMIIAVAETYDLVVTIPESMSYEFKATPEDRTSFTSLWIGDGMKMPAPSLPSLKYFDGMKMMNNMMNFDGSMDDMGMQMSAQSMDMNVVMYPEITGPEKGEPKDKVITELPEMQHEHHNMTGTTAKEIVTLAYTMLRATEKTTLPDAPFTEMHFELTGNMNRYQWTINNKTVSETDKILIRKGDNVRIIMYNNSMMRHPMHLHGQFFRVKNGQGEFAPLKNVLDVMPMETDTIEFAAPYDGDWFFHCHILYHMMSGMGRVFSVGTIGPNVQLDTIKNVTRKFERDDKMLHFSGRVAVHTQGIFAEAMLMNKDYVLAGMGMANYTGEYETEITLARYFGTMQYFKAYIGTDISKLEELHHNGGDTPAELVNEAVATVGIQYLLPFFLQTDLRIDHTGHVRFQVSRHDLALTSRLRFEGMWNTDMEYELGLSYILTKRWSASANYDSHFGAGVGISFTY
ncbi:MAG: multicopper oxidase domain-containing protein [Chitinophagales bacterium]|nr:multicopper oxidase domain-containing protein [Chitinophagales bacterium]